MHILEVDTKGETVADLGPPVPDDTPANLDITVTAKSVPRPSLEVESEVHAHLAPRIEAHLRRIEGWDTRTVPRDLAENCTALRERFRALGETLAMLKDAGFVAKSTASSRKRAALRPGTAVKLRPDIHADTVGLFYAEDELASLTVAKVGESSVLLVTAGGREIGPLPFAHVVMG
jgi:hypothetical protein